MIGIYAILMDSVCAGTSVLFGALEKISLETAILFGGVLSLVGLLLFATGTHSTNVPAATVSSG